MNGLSLFSGIGGIDLALEPWVRTVSYCEIDPYCRSVLQKHINKGDLDDAPIFYDVTCLYPEHIREPVDIVFGGFPCQDISLAGKRAGLDGERSGLYREVIRLVAECEPSYVFLENVAAIRGHAWRVVEDLARLGFDCRWTSLSAAAVGAPHKRDRWWLLAAHPERLLMANPDSVRELQPQGGEQKFGRWSRDSGGEDLSFWTTEPNVGRVAHGVPARVDRLKSLGNAVVPAQAREAFKYLMGIDRG